MKNTILPPGIPGIPGIPAIPAWEFHYFLAVKQDSNW
jgi:hypothetical protein